MRHLPRLLIATILIIITTAVVAKAEQVSCDDYMLGKFTGEVESRYYEETYMQTISVLIYTPFRKYDRIIETYAKVNIPCGTKVRAATYQVYCSTEDHGSPKLILVDNGSSQCTLGNDITLYHTGDDITLSTHIYTPGFDGRYELQRVMPVP